MLQHIQKDGTILFATVTMTKNAIVAGQLRIGSGLFSNAKP
jgi:hypothetical protein